MTTEFDKVKEFLTTFTPDRVANKPKLCDIDQFDLGYNLICEELDELTKAYDEKNLVEVADALADLIYVVHNVAVFCGLPMNQVFDEVHDSNMSKLGEDGKPILREDGKVLKGPNYRQPELASIIQKLV